MFYLRPHNVYWYQTNLILESLRFCKFVAKFNYHLTKLESVSSGLSSLKICITGLYNRHIFIFHEIGILKGKFYSNFDFLQVTEDNFRSLTATNWSFLENNCVLPAIKTWVLGVISFIFKDLCNLQLKILESWFKYNHLAAIRIM